MAVTPPRGVQTAPPSVVTYQFPLVVSAPMIAMPSVPLASGSVTLRGPVPAVAGPTIDSIGMPTAPTGKPLSSSSDSVASPLGVSTGGSLTALTVRVAVFETVSVPSLTSNRIVTAPDQSSVGVKVQGPLPETVPLPS